MRRIPAVHFTPLVGPRAVTAIVMHSTEGQEIARSAEGTANYFGGKAKDPAPRASTHFVVDADEVIQCVRLQDVAWGAEGLNSTGIHIEMAGRAAQSAADWGDPYSLQMLFLASRLVAELCSLCSIPAVFLLAPELQRKLKGITTHAQVTIAFRLGTHTDPGPSWPGGSFVAQVVHHLRVKQQLGPFL